MFTELDVLQAGKKGVSFTFVTSRDYPKFKEIEKYANIKMEKMKLPTKSDVEKESLDNLFDKVNKNIIRAEDQENYTEVLNKLLAEGHSLYDISASLLKMVKESTNKTKIKDLDRVDYGKSFEMSKGSDSSKRKSKDMKKIKGPKIFINKGKRDGLDSRDIIRHCATHRPCS
ncbi:MAG: hypothetical protein ACLT39_00790 [Peptoniphilus sp.]